MSNEYAHMHMTLSLTTCVCVCVCVCVSMFKVIIHYLITRPVPIMIKKLLLYSLNLH